METAGTQRPRPRQGVPPRSGVRARPLLPPVPRPAPAPGSRQALAPATAPAPAPAPGPRQTRADALASRNQAPPPAPGPRQAPPQLRANPPVPRNQAAPPPRNQAQSDGVPQNQTPLAQGRHRPPNQHQGPGLTRTGTNRARIPPAATQPAPAQVAQPPANRNSPRYTCLICTEPVNLSPFFPGDESHVLPCRHIHCPSCLAAGLRSSLTTMPFRPVGCCDFYPRDQGIPIADIRYGSQTRLTHDEITAYRAKLAEHSATSSTSSRNPALYCFDPKCSAFIPGVLCQNNVGKCRKCKKRTCVLCRGQFHMGRGCPTGTGAVGGGVQQQRKARPVWVSPEERKRRREALEAKYQERFRLLSVAMGWKRCPRCSVMVEKIDGCNHMLCSVCNTHFCYRCGRAPYGNHGPCAM